MTMMRNNNSFVNFSHEGHIARICLDRKDKNNALNIKMLSEILLTLKKIEKDNMLRVVCFESSVKKYFCAGGDLNEMVTGKNGKAPLTMKKYIQVLKKIVTFPKPTVCKVEGNVLGGGVGLMLACDIVVIADNVKIATPEINIGLFPIIVGTLLLRNIHLKKLMKMAILGDYIDAYEAEKIGLVSIVVKPEEITGTVNTILNKISEKSPHAIKVGKEAIIKMGMQNFTGELEFSRAKLINLLSAKETVERIQEFLKK